jgi:trans-aconitate 2-methyltransferase
MWDPTQYSRFRDERSRPFFELLARIRHLDPKRIVDLGCGTGSLTEVLADLWLDADITGIDRSAEMLSHADALARPNLHFLQLDIADFKPKGEDLILSNAALHWIPNHDALILRLAKSLPAGGTLAFQVPANFDAPSHVLLKRLCDSSEYRAFVGDPKRHGTSHSAVEYARTLLNHGFTVDAWETTYVQVLPGEDAVFEWMAGTTLRPIFAALTNGLLDQFTADFKQLLRKAYPASSYGTVYEFRRVFVIARAPELDKEERLLRAAAAEPVAIQAAEGDEITA